ncbi:MAG: hypothetical protein P8188_11490 [Gemmatimonadota bacterium]
MTDATWPGLGDDEIGALGTGPPAMLRTERYRGTGQECGLERLELRDQETVRLLYDHLRGIYDVWRRDPTAPDWEAIAIRTLALSESGLMGRVGAMGSGLGSAGESEVASGADDPGTEGQEEEAVVQRVLHDLRGGAATAVLAEAELLEPGLRSALKRGVVGSEGLEAVVLLARDQAKMMRNALVDLDPEERSRDTVENPHRIDDLVERWADVRYRTLDGLVHVRADRDEPGLLSSCCLEFGAVDRITYNLVNNAARHSPDGQIALQARRAGGASVLIAVTNRVDEEHGRWLTASLREDPGALFRWGSTRRGVGAGGGAGLGLGIVAEFVAAAFGVPSVAEALEGGHLGATLLGDRLSVWFHWPAYQPGGGG